MATENHLFGPFADWRKPEEYADPDSINPKQWAWEFLRRNPQYQNDFNKFRREIESDGFPIINQENILMAEKYGLSFIFSNPNDDFSQVRPEALRFLKTGSQVRYVGRIFQSQKKGEVALKFDVTKPIEPQIQSAKTTLNFERKRLGFKDPNHHIKKFATYLRVLDAEQSGIPPNKIASIIFPNIINEYPDYAGAKRVFDALESAKRYRDHDFIYLPFLSSFPKKIQ